MTKCRCEGHEGQVRLETEHPKLNTIEGAMSDPARKPERHYTYGNLKSFPDSERWEIIEGILYDMSPAPRRKHQRVSALLQYELMSIAEPLGCQTYDAPFDVRLPPSGAEDQDTDSYDDEIDTVVQPDIVVVCDETKLDDAGCRGAPDLVVEILSPHTSFKDQTEKLALYERVGVLEYWIVNPEARWLMIYRQDEGSAGSTGAPRFVKPDYYRSNERAGVGILGDAEIELTRIFQE